MEIYQLKVTLHIKPPIWRRVGYLAKSSSANCTASCRPPWVGPTFICMPSGSAMNVMACPIRTSPPTKNERNIRLDSIVQQGGRLFYDYDFGDGWEHEIKVEKILPAETAVHYPHCVDGKRACPPEDCGGPHGYEYLLEALADSEHEKHDSMIEWAGGELDPEAFDVEKVNQVLWRMK